MAEKEKDASEVVDSGSTTVVEDAVVEAGEAEANADASVEEVATAGEETVETTQKAADVSEVEGEPDFTKMFQDLQGAIESGLEKNLREAQEAIEKTAGEFTDKIEELSVKHTELVSKFESLKGEVENVEKALRAVEGETAIKKSGDLGGSKEDDKLEKSSESVWGGRFLMSNLNK